MNNYEEIFAKSNKTDAILVVEGVKLHVNKAVRLLENSKISKTENFSCSPITPPTLTHFSTRISKKKRCEKFQLMTSISTNSPHF